MAKPTSVALRERIGLLFEQGQSAAAIARKLGLCASTVRDLLRRLQQQGQQGLVPSYQACGQHHASSTKVLYQQTVQLREQHPRWGAGRIRIELQARYASASIPCERTLQRWLRQAQVGKTAPPGRPRSDAYVRADLVHQRWQIDAGDQKELATGEGVCWLRVADECSGALLQSVVFSPTVFQQRQGYSGARSVPPSLYDVGTSRADSLGQWLSLGQRQ